MKKSTAIVAVVFVALLVGAYWLMSKKPERGITRISFAAVDKDKIDRVVIGGPNATELRKQGEQWQLASGKEADADAVKRLVEAIPKVDSTDLVTKDEARFAELEVNDDKGAAVTAFANGVEVAKFVVGKAASGGANVRVGSAVYVVPGLAAHLFSKPASSWQQLKLFADKIEDVSRVEVTLAGQPSYALIKKDDNWELEDAKLAPANFRFDKNAARSLVSSLVNARASKVLDSDPGADKTALTDKADLLAFVGKEGAKRTLQLGATGDDKSVYARAGGKPDVYQLAEYSAKNLRKQVTDLRDFGMMKVEKDKAKKLSIATAKLKLEFEKTGADWKLGKSSEAVPKDFELDMMLVQRRVQALDTARGLRLADPGTTPQQAGITKPSASIAVVLEDGKPATLVFGNEFKDGDRDAVYAKGNADDSIYVVAKWTRDNLTGGLAGFKKRPEGEGGMPNIDPAAMQNLPPDVRASLMKQFEQKKREQEMMKSLQAQMANKAPASAPAK